MTPNYIFTLNGGSITVGNPTQVNGKEVIKIEIAFDTAIGSKGIVSPPPLEESLPEKEPVPEIEPLPESEPLPEQSIQSVELLELLRQRLVSGVQTHCRARKKFEQWELDLFFGRTFDGKKLNTHDLSIIMQRSANSITTKISELKRSGLVPRQKKLLSIMKKSQSLKEVLSYIRIRKRTISGMGR